MTTEGKGDLGRPQGCEGLVAEATNSALLDQVGRMNTRVEATHQELLEETG